MGKKLLYTPTSQIKNNLRKMWLQSRERNQAIRREGNTCQRCGLKGSVAKGREVKIEVHHIEGIEWEGIIKFIRDNLLINPDGLEVLCRDCHKEETKLKEVI